MQNVVSFSILCTCVYLPSENNFPLPLCDLGKQKNTQYCYYWDATSIQGNYKRTNVGYNWTNRCVELIGWRSSQRTGGRRRCTFQRSCRERALYSGTEQPGRSLGIFRTDRATEHTHDTTNQLFGISYKLPFLRQTTTVYNGGVPSSDIITARQALLYGLSACSQII